MDLICLKQQLQKNIQLAERYIGRLSSAPSLTGVFMEAQKNYLIIRSTDLNIGFESKIAAEVKKEGSVVVAPHPVVALLSSLNTEKIKIEVKNNNLYFTTPKTTTAVKIYSSENFPKLPKIKNEQKIIFKTNNLLSNLKSVSFCSSTSDIKPEITSILFKDCGKKIKFVATDSFRLAEKTSDQEEGIKNQIYFLFPARAAAEFMRLLDNFQGELEFNLTNSHLFINHPSFSFFTNLTEGKFPEYEQIIPTTFTTEVTVNRSELMENLKLSGIFAGRLREAGLRIYPEDNLLEILTNDSELGEHTSQLTAQITGESLNIAFNQRYLLEGLDPISSENVILRFCGQNKPLVIQSPTDLSYIYLIMPMKNV
ncbi:MAG: DNA polymerase III subunit beta [Patescibacteria group bacterium]